MSDDMSGMLHNLWLRTSDKADRDMLYAAGGRLYRLETALAAALRRLDAESAAAVRSLLRDGDLPAPSEGEAP